MQRYTCGAILVSCLIPLLVTTLANEGHSQTTTVFDEESGVVARVDIRHDVVIFDDGRIVRTTPSSVIMAGGKPTAVCALLPGTLVVVQAAEPVVLRNGEYVVLSDSPAASVTAAIAARTRTFGLVKDVDRDGDVKIETPAGVFHVKFSADAARRLKEGDTATIDVTVTAPVPPSR